MFYISFIYLSIYDFSMYVCMYVCMCEVDAQIFSIVDKTFY